LTASPTTVIAQITLPQRSMTAAQARPVLGVSKNTASAFGVLAATQAANGLNDSKAESTGSNAAKASARTASFWNVNSIRNQRSIHP